MEDNTPSTWDNAPERRRLRNFGRAVGALIYRPNQDTESLPSFDANGIPKGATEKRGNIQGRPRTPPPTNHHGRYSTPHQTTSAQGGYTNPQDPYNTWNDNNTQFQPGYGPERHSRPNYPSLGSNSSGGQQDSYYQNGPFSQGQTHGQDYSRTNYHNQQPYQPAVGYPSSQDPYRNPNGYGQQYGYSNLSSQQPVVSPPPPSTSAEQTGQSHPGPWQHPPPPESLSPPSLPPSLPPPPQQQRYPNQDRDYYPGPEYNDRFVPFQTIYKAW